MKNVVLLVVVLSLFVGVANFAFSQEEKEKKPILERIKQLEQQNIILQEKVKQQEAIILKLQKEIEERLGNSVPIYVRGSSWYACPPVYPIIKVGSNILCSIDNRGNLPEHPIGFTLVVLKRNDLSVVKIAHYNTGNWPNKNEEAANNMANYLNQLDLNHIVLVASYNDWVFNFNDNLEKALVRCGANKQVLSARLVAASSYVLVGIPNIGEGNGIEVLAHNDTSGKTPNVFAEIHTWIKDGAIVGAYSHK